MGSPPVTSYQSLTNALSDFAHRADIAGALTDSVVPTDYFIQGALEAIQNDIPDLNFGNYIRYMENAYPQTPINFNSTTFTADSAITADSSSLTADTGGTAYGTAPVPADWLGPKVMTVSDGSSDFFTLIFKSAAWIYDRYPVRQPSGLPAYIARDVIANGGGFPSTLAYQTFTTSLGQTTFNLNSNGGVLSVVVNGVTLIPSIDYVLTGAVLILAAGTLAGQTLYVQYLAQSSALQPSGLWAFIFGPFPDSAYNIQGTYYQQIPALSTANPTNWVTKRAPMMLHAACMVEVGKFLLDDALIQRWASVYQQRLKALVDADKAERWGAATLQIETA